MNDILLNLIVLAVTAAGIGLIFLFVRRKQHSREEKIKQLAAEKGWNCETIDEPLRRGFRLQAAGWTLEAFQRSSGEETGPGSTDTFMLTSWQADAPGSTVLLGAQTSQVDLGSAGETLIRQVLQLSLGEDALGLKQVQSGSQIFHQEYMLWVQDPEAVRISPAIESLLLQWKGPKPLVKRTQAGLSIEIRGVCLKEPDRILALVQLGELLQFLFGQVSAPSVRAGSG